METQRSTQKIYYTPSNLITASQLAIDTLTIKLHKSLFVQGMINGLKGAVKENQNSHPKTNSWQKLA